MIRIRDSVNNGVPREHSTLILDGADVLLKNQQIILTASRQYTNGDTLWLIQLAHPTRHDFITLEKFRGCRTDAEAKLRKYLVI